MSISGLGASIYRDVRAKTASYYVHPDDSGVLFTTRGGGAALTFTLPDTTKIPVGWWCEFFNVADQNMVVAARTADTMIVFNDATADSVSFATAGQKIGGGVQVIWDGTGWITKLYYLENGATTQTVTIATA